jgi:RNA polymerase sigma-70 factor (ECF subfamily)
MPKPQPSKIVKDNDAELIQAIQAGQSDRFYELVMRYEQSLFNFGLRMCGGAQDAEDVVQETFLNVFKYLENFRFETKFKNWLYRIAVSVCIKKKRKSKYAPDRELSLEEFLPVNETQIPKELPNWAKIPIDQLLNRELFQVIHDSVFHLPEKYRIVWVLRDIEGFSTVETAQMLGLTPSNIKVRLHRARLFLRDQLRSYFNYDR